MNTRIVLLIAFGILCGFEPIRADEWKTIRWHGDSEIAIADSPDRQVVVAAWCQTSKVNGENDVVLKSIIVRNKQSRKAMKVAGGIKRFYGMHAEAMEFKVDWTPDSKTAVISLRQKFGSDVAFVRRTSSGNITQIECLELRSLDAMLRGILNKKDISRVQRYWLTFEKFLSDGSVLLSGSAEVPNQELPLRWRVHLSRLLNSARCDIQKLPDE